MERSEMRECPSRIALRSIRATCPAGHDTQRLRPDRRIHPAGDAVPGELLLEHPPDLRVLILVFDLVAARLHALIDREGFGAPRPGKLPAAGPQRQIARRI